MRVFFITSKLNFLISGGSVTDLDLKAENIAKAGHDVSVLTVFSSKNSINKKLEYKIIEENIDANKQFSIQKKIFQLLKKYSSQADIFHIEGQYMYAAGIYRLLGGKVPIVAFFNRELISWPKENGMFVHSNTFIQRLKSRIILIIEKYIGTKFANKIDFFIFTTPFLQKAFYKFGLNKKIAHQIIPDFVDCEKVTKLIKTSVAEAIANREKNKIFQIYSSGRLIPEKGFDIMIKAFALLPNIDSYHLVVGGDGPEKKNLMNLVKDLNLEGKVSFPGWLSYSEMIEYLNKSNLFVLPRWRTELSSVILFEAMCLGLPCLVQSGGGLSWLVGNDDLTFEDKNQKDLAKKIEYIFTQKNLSSKLGEYCHNRVNEEFGIKKLSRKLESILI